MIAPVVDCPDLMVSDMTQEIGFVQVCISLVSCVRLCVYVCVCLLVSAKTRGFNAFVNVQTIKDGESPDYDRHPLGSLLQLVSVQKPHQAPHITTKTSSSTSYDPKNLIKDPI